MIRWTEQSAPIRFQSIERLYAQLAVPDVLQLIASDDERPVVIIPERVRAAVLAHFGVSREERGGLLVGEVFGESAPRAIRVLEAIPSRDYTGTAVSLRMEAAVWSEARAALAPDRLIVGWVHSHPGLTAFFSDTDRRTQRAFFSHAYSIGWVIDPVNGDERVYCGADSTPVARVFTAQSG